MDRIVSAGKRRREMVQVVSGSPLCFLQLMWLCWLCFMMTVSSYWVVCSRVWSGWELAPPSLRLWLSDDNWTHPLQVRWQMDTFEGPWEPLLNMNYTSILAWKCFYVPREELQVTSEESETWTSLLPWQPGPTSTAAKWMGCCRRLLWISSPNTGEIVN